MTKSKEDIIKEIIPLGIVNVKGKGDGKPQYQAEKDAIGKCMDEYAQQEAIEFLKWADNKAVRNGHDDWTVGVGSSIKHFTSEELFNLYLQSKQSNP